jgi:hypothetical protein
MSRALTADSSLETLKKEAKRWLKAIRAADTQAIQRLVALTSVDPATAGLRDVQLALAREYGLPGWTALRQALEDMRRSHAERVEEVLRSAAWQADRSAAIRIVRRWPEIRNENLYTAVATGSLEELERLLASDPAAATRKGGPLDWEPLLYLAYARLPGGEEQALAMARLLLDQGADPNARWTGSWGPPAFTVLTGVIGEGEENHPPHPQAAALVSLLVERGATPAICRRSTTPRFAGMTRPGWKLFGRTVKGSGNSSRGRRRCTRPRTGCNTGTAESRRVQPHLFGNDGSVNRVVRPRSGSGECSTPKIWLHSAVLGA